MTVTIQPNHSDAGELQEILTRYIDSRDGYFQAAELVEETGLSGALSAIAKRREGIAARMATIINQENRKADLEGSPEASLHRWWIRLRGAMTHQETETILGECLRGEKELERTLGDALEHGHLQEDHRQVIQEALDEVKLAVEALGRSVGE